MIDKDEWYKEQDKGTTDSTCVGDELLGLLFKNDYYDDWDGYNDTPDTFHDFSVVLKE